MAFEFYTEHVLRECDEYRLVLHELRDGDDQMLTIHIKVDPELFSLGVLRRIDKDFTALRGVTDALLFAIEPNPDDEKWERFVSLFGFEFSSRVDCTDGQSRRCFISKKNNEHGKHADPDDLDEHRSVVRPAALP